MLPLPLLPVGVWDGGGEGDTCCSSGCDWCWVREWWCGGDVYSCDWGVWDPLRSPLLLLPAPAPPPPPAQVGALAVDCACAAANKACSCAICCGVRLDRVDKVDSGRDVSTLLLPSRPPAALLPLEVALLGLTPPDCNGL